MFGPPATWNVWFIEFDECYLFLNCWWFEKRRNFHVESLMMTSSNGKKFRVTGPLCGEFTGHRWISPQKGQWRGALMFSLICGWINGWTNNREAGDLRHYRAHYDVTVMVTTINCMTDDVMKYCLNSSSRIYASINQISIGSESGLSPRHYLNKCLLSIEPLTTILGENLIKLFIHNNSSENIVCEKGAILSRGEMSYWWLPRIEE